MKIAIYARYSSDMQNPNSVGDQVNLCRQYIDCNWPGSSVVEICSDEAMSAATVYRPGFQSLLDVIRSGRVDIVISEGLDRLSRSLKDIAALGDLVEYYDTSLHTVQEGKIEALHIGIKGTQNQMFRKDLKVKTKRGLEAVCREGRVPGGITYGYKMVLDATGRIMPGHRAVREDQAAVVRRIYQEYIDGKPIKDIVRGLNNDGIPSPRGGKWQSERLRGTRKRQDGILFNPIYKGVIVWNRREEKRDPETGKTRIVIRDPSEFVCVKNEELRIVSDEIWDKAQKGRRQSNDLNAQVARIVKPAPPHPKKIPTVRKSGKIRPFTFLVNCGACGGPKKMAGKTRYVCDGSRYTGQCRNSRGWNEKKIFSWVMQEIDTILAGQTNFLDEIHNAFHAEKEREHEKKAAAALIRGKLSRILEAVENGMHIPEAVERSKQLNAELKKIEETSIPWDFPDCEESARTDILSTVEWIKQNFDNERETEKLGLLFRALIKKIVFTPIPDEKRGETAELFLQENGWAEFWRQSCQK